MVFFVLSSCDYVSNETYHKMSPDERRARSAEYTQLAKRIELGSSENMRLLEKALRINPSNDQAHFDLSLPYLYNGIYDKYHEHISKAIELNPQAWQGFRGYHKLFYLRDFGGALVDLDATDSLTIDQTDFAQNMSVDYMRAICYYGLSNLEKSKEYFEIFIEKERSAVGESFIDENAFLFLGMIENKKGDYDQALNYFDRAVKYENGQADVHYHRAYSLQMLDNLDEAQREIEKAKSLYEEGKYLRGYNYETIGQIYLSDILNREEDIINHDKESQT